MNLPYDHLNFGLDLDLDIEAQEITKANGTERLYKLMVAKRFKHNIWNYYIKRNKWFVTLAIFIFVINFKYGFCKNYYLQWFYVTLSKFLIKRHELN